MILKQYQTQVGLLVLILILLVPLVSLLPLPLQVGAALRPSFVPDTAEVVSGASHVTVTACDVCCTWSSSSVARDLKDLRRVYQILVYQILVSSLAKLKKGFCSSC
jgi:hypothetical protein